MGFGISKVLGGGGGVSKAFQHTALGGALGFGGRGGSSRAAPMTKDSLLESTGYGYGELPIELQKQLQGIEAGGFNRDKVKAFQETLGSVMGQQRQFQPYQEAGMSAFDRQQALLGLKGQDAMQQAYMENPAQAFQRKQSEQALMRNAAATGGLGGSGVQKELAELTAGLTNQFQQQQLAQLGGIAGRGYDASQSLANIYGTGYADMGALGAGYGEERARAKAAKDAERSGLGSTLGTAAGYAFGGPVGGMVGGALGGML